MIRVVVADDSPFICRLLTQYLDSDPEIRVIKTVLNGKEAIEAVKELKPDVLTLDVNMPILNGMAAVKQIMAQCPTSVVMITGATKESAKLTSEALSVGAVDFIFKYSPDTAIPPDALRRDIISKVKAASKIKVIRSIPSIKARFGDNKKQDTTSYFNGVADPKTGTPKPLKNNFSRIVVIGASTGGPLAVKELLSTLKKGFPFPIVIVQHMPANFTATLAEQYDRIFPFSVKEATEGEILIPGTVYIAPGDQHMLISQGGMVHINKSAPINGHRPSIDVTMQSAALVYGRYTTGVVLSGMGNDGTEGLLAVINNCGTTYAQSKDTCVIDSMPSSAIKKGVVQQIGSPKEIGMWISEMKHH